MLDLNHGSGPISPGARGGYVLCDHQCAHRRGACDAEPQPGPARLSRRQPGRRALRPKAGLRACPQLPGPGSRLRGTDPCGPFDAGHAFEALSITWLRAAGFVLRDRRDDGRQFGFVTAGGRLRGHVDGLIVDGPDVGVVWPALWEHKALNANSWSDLVKRGLRLLEADLLRSGPALHGVSRARPGDRLCPPRSTRTTRRCTTRSYRSKPRGGAGALRPRRRHHPCRRRRQSAATHRQQRRLLSLSHPAPGRSAAGRRRAHELQAFAPPQVDAMAERFATGSATSATSARPSGSFGYAGTGKTTITPSRHRRALGLDLMDRDNGGVETCSTPPSPARPHLVMSRNGTPASTIHSLIYRFGSDAGADRPRPTRKPVSSRAGLGAMGAAERTLAKERSCRLLAAAGRGPTPAALRAQRAVVVARRRPASSWTRSRWSTSPHGPRPPCLRQADPGARRSRAGAADPRRGRLHRCRAAHPQTVSSRSRLIFQSRSSRLGL